MKVNSAEDLFALQGQSLGVSNWFGITQDLIDNFAKITMDCQWIHIDVEKAQKQSPIGTTVAHGYLLLSLVPHLLEDVLVVNNLAHIVNSSIKEVNFQNFVPSGSQIRLKASLGSVKKRADICKTEINFELVQENEDISAVQGTIVYMYCFCNE